MTCPELPPLLNDLIADVLRQTGLRRLEREDIARELEAHFRDALTAGMSEEGLLVVFGDARRAAKLIRRSKLRARPLAWRLSRAIVTAAGGAFLLLCALYAWSALHLYTVEPRRSDPLENTAVEFQRVVELILADAEQNTEAGQGRAAAENLAAALSIAARLRHQPSLEQENAALVILRRAADGILTLLRKRPAIIDERELVLLDSRIRACALGGQVTIRASSVRATLRELIERMYAQNGHLTARGLRLFQVMLGKTHPGFSAYALEPLYFIAPADSNEVEAAMENLTAGSAEIDTVANWPAPSLRMPPLVALNPQIKLAVHNAHEASGVCKLALAEIDRSRNGAESKGD